MKRGWRSDPGVARQNPKQQLGLLAKRFHTQVNPQGFVPRICALEAGGERVKKKSGFYVPALRGDSPSNAPAQPSSPKPALELPQSAKAEVARKLQNRLKRGGRGGAGP